MVFFGCGIWLIGLGIYFMFLRPSFLPEDLRYMGATPSQMQSASPRFDNWVQLIFTVMGGFMTGAGLLTVLAARNLSRLHKKQTLILLALAGIMSVGTMSVTNFQIGSDFKWLLLLPSLLWATGLALVAASDG